jgi:hypothetical protein
VLNFAVVGHAVCVAQPEALVRIMLRAASAVV